MSLAPLRDQGLPGVLAHPYSRLMEYSLSVLGTRINVTPFLDEIGSEGLHD